MAILGQYVLVGYRYPIHPKCRCHCTSFCPIVELIIRGYGEPSTRFMNSLFSRGTSVVHGTTCFRCSTVLRLQRLRGSHLYTNLIVWTDVDWWLRGKRDEHTDWILIGLGSRCYGNRYPIVGSTKLLAGWFRWTRIVIYIVLKCKLTASFLRNI